MLTDDDKKWLAETFATKDDLRDMETKLLTAFHDWTGPQEKRIQSHTNIIAALELERPNLHTMALEIIALRQRLDKLEQK